MHNTKQSNRITTIHIQNWRYKSYRAQEEYSSYIYRRKETCTIKSKVSRWQYQDGDLKYFGSKSHQKDCCDKKYLMQYSLWEKELRRYCTTSVFCIFHAMWEITLKWNVIKGKCFFKKNAELTYEGINLIINGFKKITGKARGTVLPWSPEEKS